MTYFLVYFIIGIFIALLFLNIYFRVKVFKYYKVLMQNRIEFGAPHILNKERLETEILTQYPSFRNEIIGFTDHIRKSIIIAACLVILITIMGLILRIL